MITLQKNKAIEQLVIIVHHCNLKIEIEMNTSRNQIFLLYTFLKLVLFDLIEYYLN